MINQSVPVYRVMFFVALLKNLWTLAWLAGLIAGWTVLRLLWTVARTTRCAAVEVVLAPQCDWAEKTSLVLRFGKRIRLRRGAIKPELEPQIRANELLVVEDIIGVKVWEEDPVEA